MILCVRSVDELGDLSHSDLSELPWAKLARPYGTIEMQLIRCSRLRNVYASMVRWPAGTTMPRHYHTGGVHSYTFRGRWRYLEHDWVATAGSYVYEPIGTTHTLVVDQDVEALFIVEGGMIWYGPDGKMQRYETAGAMHELISAALAAQGLELPDIVVQD